MSEPSSAGAGTSKSRTTPSWTATKGPDNAPPMLKHSLPRALALALVLVCGVSACGGDGTAPAIPPAPPTSQPPGDLVLYVAALDGDRVDAFRLGTDGLPQAEPFSSMPIPEPRRLAFADGVLFVAGGDRVATAVVDEDGALPATPTSASAISDGMDNLEMVIANDHVYVASSGFSSINAYPIDEQGRIPISPSSTGFGSLPSDYATLALNGRFLYAGTRGRAQIDVFLLQSDGEIPQDPENQEPDTFVLLPDAIAFANGVLYTASGEDATIRGYIPRSNGLLLDEPDGETRPEEFVGDLVVNEDLIYAAAFNAGQIFTYDLDPVTHLPIEASAITETQQDAEAFPLGLTHSDGILYVSQGGHDRVDAYVLRTNGHPPAFPTGSTTPISGSFPVDTVVARIR